MIAWGVSLGAHPAGYNYVFTQHLLIADIFIIFILDLDCFPPRSLFFSGRLTLNQLETMNNEISAVIKTDNKAELK